MASEDHAISRPTAKMAADDMKKVRIFVVGDPGKLFISLSFLTVTSDSVSTCLKQASVRPLSFSFCVTTNCYQILAPPLAAR